MSFYKGFRKDIYSWPKNDATELVGMMTLAGALLGLENDFAIDFGTTVMNTATVRQSMLPIHYDYRVPTEYYKKYDKEEYLLEIYKKIGIEVLHYYDRGPFYDRTVTVDRINVTL